MKKIVGIFICMLMLGSATIPAACFVNENESLGETFDEFWIEEDKIWASDYYSGDHFGWSVSISGEYALAGALFNDNKGSAYVFKRSGTTWTEEQILWASNGDSDDRFGSSVSISGDYAIIGAPYNSELGWHAGVAYVFKRSGTTWTEEQKLLPSDGQSADYFGDSVSIDGDYAIVGSPWDDDNELNSGSAYVFKRSGTTWTEEQKLHASDAGYYNYFGGAVSINGEYVTVGAPLDDDFGTDSGSAYVFKRSGTTWTEEQILWASDGDVEDYFGRPVSINGDYTIIGSANNDDFGDQSGSAYVFKRSGTTWTEEQKLLPSDGEYGDYFGAGLSINGDYAIVGAWGHDDNGETSGAAYVFKRSGTTWTEEQKLLASDGAGGDGFGNSISMDGDYAIIGADQDGGIYETGSAYIFKKNINNPPLKPSTPTGPTSGETGETYTYSSTTTDPEDQQIYYKFDWDDGTYSDWMGPYLSGETGSASHSWDNTGTYNIKAKAKDQYNAESDWSEPLMVTINPPNNPPYQPSNPDPYDGEPDVDVNADLSWTGGDPDPGDTVTYDVYFEANDPTPDILVSNDQSETTFNPGTLDYETHYYWKIVATDNHGASTTGPIWDFITEEPPENFPPEISEENPENLADNVSIMLTELSVYISDPEYDEFSWTIETSPDIGSISGINENDGTKVCLVNDILDFSTTYTWYVNATDTESGYTSEKIYVFSTIDNYPPNSPKIDGPPNGDSGDLITFTFSAIDPDGDDVRFHINWGDGDTDTTSYVESGDEQTASHSWIGDDEVFIITVSAEDSNGLAGPESTFDITIPRTRSLQYSIFSNFLSYFTNLFLIFRILLHRLG